ncbi:MAG: YbaN family protein [Candidatus Omnitrophica bacterium]|nr:YbaN family protein [Candidatus Omnitrophota bacterium]
MNHLKRTILMCAGFLFAALGIIGAFLPVMPSIPFFIIASICFSKSSEKFHNMLLNNRWIGPHIKNYHENNGITLKTKILLIVFQWVGILGSSILFIHNFFGRILMVIIAIGATAYTLSLKTAKG